MENKIFLIVPGEGFEKVKTDKIFIGIIGDLTLMGKSLIDKKEKDELDVHKNEISILSVN